MNRNIARISDKLAKKMNEPRRSSIDMDVIRRIAFERVKKEKPTAKDIEIASIGRADDICSVLGSLCIETSSYDFNIRINCKTGEVISSNYEWKSGVATV